MLRRRIINTIHKSSRSSFAATSSQISSRRHAIKSSQNIITNTGTSKNALSSSSFNHYFSASSFSSSSSQQQEQHDDTNKSQLQYLLTPSQRQILKEQKEFIKRVEDIVLQVDDVEMRDCSNRFLLDGLILPGGREGSSGDGREEEETMIDSTFAIVIAGEFNAGKSTLINALLGQKLLETGALPTTDEVTIVADDSSSDSSLSSTTTQPNISTTRHNSNSGGIGTIALHRITNIPILQDLTFIDTPGTNAVITNHTSKTVKLLPSADLILFVTSADRPFPESELQLLKSIQSYRKSIVVVVNKMDVLEAMGGNYGQEEKDRVVNFVKENASELLGVNPIVIPISARDALSSKLMHGEQSTSATLKRSNFHLLESFLQQTLTTESKIQSKLLNPIGVAEGMISDCIQQLSKQKVELHTDNATLNLLESQMNGWSKEMMEILVGYRMDILNVLKREGGRCSRLVERISYWQQVSWFLLSDGGRFENEWNLAKKASSQEQNNVETEIATIVRESSDSIATNARAQGQAVIEYLGKRPAVTSQSLIGSVTAASRFEHTRNDMSTKMTKAAKDVLSDYDPTVECNQVAQSLKQTIIFSALLNTSALTSGISTAMELLDITSGSISTAILAILGISIVPLRNKQTVSQMESQWEERSKKLDESLETLSTKEMQRIERRIMDGVAPYTRYVRTEQERVNSLMSMCEDCQSVAQSLRNRIVKLRNT